jgi:hypothetical protein
MLEWFLNPFKFNYDHPVDHRTFVGMNVDPVEMGKYECEVELVGN